MNQSANGNNNFEILRLIAAVSVILAHAYGLRGEEGVFSRITGLDLGWCAVVMFFAISGYLIAGSAAHRSAAAFWKARGLRIFPGLLFCTLTTGILLGFFSSEPMRDYYSSSQTYRYIFGTGTLLSTEYDLPGVFENLHSHQANGSLWTLRYEITSYLLIFVIVKAASYARLETLVFTVSALVLCVFFYATFTSGYLNPPLPVRNITELFIPFAAGASLYGSKRIISLSLHHILLVFIAVALLWVTPFKVPCVEIFVAALTIYLAHLNYKALDCFKRIPDYSYGIYIYAFPIQQIYNLYLPSHINPLLQALLSLVSVLIPAAFSWHFVEKPMLALKSVSLLKSAPILNR